MKRFWRKLFPCKTPSSPRSTAFPTADKPAVAEEQKKSEVEVKKHSVLCGDKGRYLVKNFIGVGAFGKVAKCVDLNTSQDVALKILRAEDTIASQREIKMLEAVSVLDSNKKNVAHFFEKFEFNSRTCLTFELLDRSLLQLFVERHCEPLSPPEIRPIAQQLLTAFDALKGIGVIHSDLKPDNIMLVNHPAEPYRVKLIDFGLSFTTSERVRGCSLQPLGYRAPEVTLGLPINESIDMWGLGCVLVWLCQGNHPFSIHCEYQTLKGIIDVLGQPANHLLNAGYFTTKFFKLIQDLKNPKWQLKTPVEYHLDTGVRPRGWKLRFNGLDDLLTVKKKMQTSFELEDQRQFVSLLKCLLQTNHQERITPQEALQHRFITMSHLKDMVWKDMDSSQYVEKSYIAMCVCPLDDSKNKPSDDKANEGTEEDRTSDSTRSRELDTPRFVGSIKNRLISTDGAAAAGAAEVTGLAEDQVTSSHGATGPAEEVLAVDQDETSPAVDQGETSPAVEETTVNQSETSPAEKELDVKHDATIPAEEQPAMEEPPVKHGATSPAEEKMVVTHGETIPAEEAPSSNKSLDEAPPLKPKKSRLKRIRNFFIRAKRTLLRKNCS